MPAAAGDAYPYPEPAVIEVPGSELLSLRSPCPLAKKKGGKDVGHQVEVLWTLWLSKVFVEAGLVDSGGWYCLPRRVPIQVRARSCAEHAYGECRGGRARVAYFRVRGRRFMCM
jgi:hypothetical protein